MKRYLKARSTFDASTVEEVEQYLKKFFKQHRNGRLVWTNTSKRPFFREYTISGRLVGYGIEMYYRDIDPDNSNRSFGGGVTLVTGYFDVAQRMMSMEDNGALFHEEF